MKRAAAAAAVSAARAGGVESARAAVAAAGAAARAGSVAAEPDPDSEFTFAVSPEDPRFDASVFLRCLSNRL